MKNYLLYFLCIFFFSRSFSQKTNQRLKISKKNEIEAYYAAGLLFIKNKNFEQALTTITLGFNESKKMNDSSLKAYGYFYKARYYENKGTYLESVALLKKALTLFDELNHTSQISRCYYQLGFNYFKSLQYDVALEYYFKSLKLDEECNYNPGIALTLERIGKLYLNTGDFYKARNSFESALRIFKELKDDPRILMNELCFAVTYQKEAMKYHKEELFYKTIEMYEVALVTSLKTNSYLTAALLQNIGSCYRFLKRYEKSLEYLFKALPLFVSKGLNKDVAHTYNDISETYIDMKNLFKAREYVLKAIDYAKGYDLHQERYAHYVLSEVDKKLLNYKSALSNFKKYQKLEDSIFSIDKTKKINELQIKYETEKQGLKIKAQESNISLLASESEAKNQFILFSGVSLFSVFLLISVYKSRNSEKKEKKLQEQFSQGLLQSQEKERTRIARELHDSVGQQLTLIKIKAQNIEEAEITALTDNALNEVRSISRGLYPPLLKELGLTESVQQLINEYDAQTDLFFTMDIDTIDAYFTENTTLNFYRLIQECLTNIVKHAKAKSVTVSIKKEGNDIITLISDNGKGFNVTESKNKNSLGLKTIFERIKIMKGKLSIDSQLNNGTSFILSIPIKNEQ